MNFSEKLLKQYKINADKKVALVCLLMIPFMLLVLILNLVNVFHVPQVPLYITVIVSFICYFLPTFFYTILKVSSEKIRYVILTIIVLESGFLYSMLSYHTIIMLVFPIVVSCLYNKKKYVLYALLLSIPMIIISHLLAFNFKYIHDEPLVTIRGVVFYGIIPRLIQTMAIGIICYFISERIENLVQTLANKNNELYQDQENLINSLAEIIENKSENTGKHVKRVALYTSILCTALGYDEETVFKVSLASMLHDVGKVMVDNKILEKPGRLTEEEFLEIKKHTTYGKKLLETSPGELFRLSSLIAYHHHEKWD